MRLFVAVDFDDSVRAAVQHATVTLRQRLERLRHATRLGWVSQDHLHLTVLFIGEVSDAVAAEIGNRLAAPLPIAPFTVRVGQLGMFPPSGRPHVVWLAVDEGVDELRRLHREVLHRLEGVEFAREGRAFSPHLTLARFREPGTVAERQALADVKLAPCGRSRVEALTLYQSRMSPRGPSYFRLRQTRLVTAK